MAPCLPVQPRQRGTHGTCAGRGSSARMSAGSVCCTRWTAGVPDSMQASGEHTGSRCKDKGHSPLTWGWKAGGHLETLKRTEGSPRGAASRVASWLHSRFVKPGLGQLCVAETSGQMAPSCRRQGPQGATWLRGVLSTSRKNEHGSRSSRSCHSTMGTTQAPRPSTRPECGQRDESEPYAWRGFPG